MEIRDAKFEDAEAIARIHAESWLQTYSRVLTKNYLEQIAPGERKEVWFSRLSIQDNNQKIVVAEIGGKIIGFACCYYGNNKITRFYLDNLHVVKEFRSRGVGKLLLKSIAIWAISKNSDSGLCLLVNQDNENAQKFYIRLGALNHSESIWKAPDGSIVPTYWFVWGALQCLTSAG